MPPAPRQAWPGPPRATHRRVEADDVVPTTSEQQRESTGAATDIEHPSATELLDETQVDGQVPSVRMSVVDSGQPRVLQLSVNHDCY